MLKLLNKVSFIVKKTTTHGITKKQLPSLVQGSPVESPSCRTLPRARRRGDTSFVARIFLRILRGAGYLILKPFLRKAWSFLRILRWVGHLILRPFLRKAWSFLRILRWARHPILRPFLRKAWSFLKNFKRGWLPDIETVS